ncbi:hypothetical protein F4777DRAFT_96191 [Nemania sp. FL0916]|nr:hypothetical protein F4777DRAFT_96191 [Nemania sp. FL0916]
MPGEILNRDFLSSGAVEPRTWEDDVNEALDEAIRSVKRPLPEAIVNTPANGARLRDPGSPLVLGRREEINQPPAEFSNLNNSQHMEILEPAHRVRCETSFLQVRESDSGREERNSMDITSSTSHTTSKDDATTYDVGDTGSVLSLQPGSYLRIAALLGFIFSFAILAITTEILLSLSNRYQGLAPAHNSLRFALKYGPTLVLTVLIALWSRVEFQAQMEAPWRRLSRGSVLAEKSLLLDYVDILAPKALWKGFMNHDWAVTLSMAATLVLIGAMLLSTTLLNFIPVPSSVPISIQVQDRFVGNQSRLLLTPWPLDPVWITIQGLLNDSTNYPEGTLNNIAYPRFQPSDETTLGYHFTVDGILFSVPCRPADLVSANIRPNDREPSDTGPYTSSVWATIAADDCEMSIHLDQAGDKKYYSNFAVGPCRGQTSLGFANIEADLNALLSITLDSPFLPIRSGLIMCFPSYQVSQMKISAWGRSLIGITPLQSNETKLLGNVTADDLLVPFSDPPPPICNTLADSLPEFCDGMIPTNDFLPWLILGVSLGSIQPTIKSMFNTSLLQDSTTRVMEQVFVFLVSNVLTEPAEEKIEGVLASSEDRVFVQSLSAHIITGLLTTSIVFICAMIITTKAHRKFPKPPANMMELAVLFSHSDNEELRTKLEKHSCALVSLAELRLRGKLYERQPLKANTTQRASAKPTTYSVQVIKSPKSKGGNTENVSPSKSQSGPAVLLVGFRLLIALFTLAIIVSLEVSLHKSQSFSGLADASQSHAWNYLWQLVPALLFTLVRLYHSAVDFNVRALQPFHNMQKGAAATSSAVMNLLDMSLPFIIGTELRSKSFAPLTTTLSRFLASFLTIFSASLFYSQSTLLVSQCQLRTEDGFRAIPSEYSPKTERATKLLFQGNATYPDFVFEDIIFPRLLITENKSGNETISPRMKYTSTVTALRPNLSCRLHNTEKNITIVFDKPNSIGVRYEIGPCDPMTSFTGVKNVIFAPEVVYVAGSNDSEIAGCAPEMNPYTVVFYWAVAVRSDPGRAVSSILVCNETLEEVDVDVTFFGPELRIDETLPPVIRENSSRPSAVEINTEPTYLYDMYELLIMTPPFPPGTWGTMSAPLSMFLASPFNLSLSDLGDASRIQETVAAIKFQLRVLRAQAVNADHRVPIHNDVVSANASEIWPRDGYMTFAATGQDDEGRLRIFQDATSTRILQALLSSILVLSLIGWALMPRAGRLLPHSATSVAETLAMLARGNIWDFLPREAQEMNKTELKSLFDGCIFRLDDISTRSESKSKHKSRGRGKNVEKPVYAIQVVRHNTG